MKTATAGIWVLAFALHGPDVLLFLITLGISAGTARAIRR